LTVPVIRSDISLIPFSFFVLFCDALRSIGGCQ
jgi:hypothetical protein